MPDLPSPLALGLHPRALIRAAIVKVLLANSACAAMFGDRIYPNRFEQWFAEELPAAGVYTLEEENLESDVSPDPDERRLSLVLELVCQADEQVDDWLDRLCLACEAALFASGAIDKIGQAMTEIIAAKIGQAVPEKNGRSLADTLILISLKKTELGIAVDGNRETGVASLNFDVEYYWPKSFGNLADFLLAYGGWDVEVSDGKIDMYSRVEFEPFNKE